MASNIVDTTIDDTYPVAGVDNDSQGFRDNFNIIKSNFVAAKAEITELQTNAILKNKLTSQDELDNDFGGNEITNALLKDCAEGVSANGTINTLQNVSYLNGVYQTGVVTGDLTLTLADWPDAGYARMVVELESDGSDTTSAGNFVVGREYKIATVGTGVVTDFTTIGSADNNPGTLFVATNTGTGDGTAIDSRQITFNGENTAQFKKIASDSWASTSATGVIANVRQSKEIYEFWTHDGGSNIYAKIVGTFS